MRPDLSKILRCIPLEIKDWWFDNPDVYRQRDFEEKCPHAHLLGKRRFGEYRGKFIDKLPPLVQKERNFTRTRNYNNPSEKIRRLHEYILQDGYSKPRTSYGHFKWQMCAANDDPETKRWANSISRRVYNETLCKMRKRGMIAPKKKVIY